MSLGLSRAVLKLPPTLRARHLVPLVTSDQLSLSSPSPLILLPTPPPERLPSSFTLYPTFFTPKEQEILLESALMALDKKGGIRRTEGGSGKKVRRTKEEIAKDKSTKPGLQGWFMDDKDYVFQDSHFDGVIKGFRETSVSGRGFPELPGQASKSFLPTPMELLQRIEYLIPDQENGADSEITMHALHLSTFGKIDGHVDGKETMGSSIVGVSLGGARVLRLEKEKESLEEGEEEHGPIDVLLQSGSVYVQTGEVRYKYKHSIPATRFYNGHRIEAGQRVSIMIRDKYLPPTPPTVPSIYDPSLHAPGSIIAPPPSHGEFYTPLSLRDESVLMGEDFRINDDRPWTYEEERGGKAMIGSRERSKNWAEKKERSNEELIARGMQRRKWGKR